MRDSGENQGYSEESTGRDKAVYKQKESRTSGIQSRRSSVIKYEESDIPDKTAGDRN